MLIYTLSCIVCEDSAGPFIFYCILPKDENLNKRKGKEIYKARFLTFLIPRFILTILFILIKM